MMKKDNFLVVVSIIEGRKFPPRGSPGRVLTIEAKFDGQTMVTDPVPHVESPNFTQELAWPVDNKSLHQHKLQRSSVKVIVCSVDPSIGSAGREEIGYVVMSLRSAQQQKSYSWQTLLNGRHKGAKLKLGIYIDEDGSGGDERGVDGQALTSSPSRTNTADSRHMKLTQMLDSVGRYFQVGSSDSNCDMFTLSVTIDSAAALLQLVPTNVALPSMPYFFYYSLLGMDITTRGFDDLLNPNFYPQQASIRLSSTPASLKQFIASRPPLEVHLFCGEQLLGSCDAPLDVLSQWTSERMSQPVAVSEYYQLRPPKTSKLVVPPVVAEDSKPRVRMTLSLGTDASTKNVNSNGQPKVPTGSKPVTMDKAGTAARPRSDVVTMESGAPADRGGPRPHTPLSTHNDSGSMEHDADISHNGLEQPTAAAAAAAGGRGDTASLKRVNDQSSPVGNATGSKQSSYNYTDDAATLTVEPSSATEHQLLVPNLPHHYSFTIDLRRIANVNVSHPVLIYLRYTYIFFGSTEAVLSRPPVEVRRGTEVVVPQSCCTFPFASTPQHLHDTLHNVPLVVEVWQRDHQRSENTCIGVAKVALSSVLRSPRTKITHSKTNTSGMRQTWNDWLPITAVGSGERHLGDVEVSLSLEDLGPIVQPTVVLDQAAQREVNIVNTHQNDVAPKPIDVRDTLEYKKAMELQLWMEEQQALYKAQEQQRLKALDEEFHRKLTVEVKKGAEYDRLAAELRSALTSLEKREKVLKASEEQVERYRDDLQHKHAREMEKLRDASVRLKEEYEHKMELERNRSRELEEIVAKLKRQVTEAETKIQQQTREFDGYKNQLNAKPEVRLQAEINLLTLEKVELEKKLDAATKEKSRYRQQLERALAKLAATEKKEKTVAKAQLAKEKQELEHMRLRYLASEEKKIISSERRELDDLKNELSQLKESTRAGPSSTQMLGGPPAAGDHNTVPAGYSRDDDGNDEIDEHILRLIEERDSLLRTGVYNRTDRIVCDLDQQIREAEARRKR